MSGEAKGGAPEQDVRRGVRERVLCPVCGRAFQTDLERPRVEAPYFPFCSERCRLVDLGQWVTGGYRISEPLPEDPSTWPTDVPREASGDEP